MPSIQYLLSYPKRPRIFSPGLIEDLEIAYLQRSLKSDILEEVTIYPRPIYAGSPSYPQVQTSIVVGKAMAMFASYSKHRMPVLYGFAYDTLSGLRESNVTCRSERGYLESLHKLSLNDGKMDSPGILNWILWGTDKIGMMYHLDTAPLVSPEFSMRVVQQAIGHKDSSAGYQPDDIVAITPNGETVQVSNKKNKTWRATYDMMIKRIPLKQDQAELDEDEFFQVLEDVEVKCTNAKRVGSITNILVESRKFEIIRQDLWGRIRTSPINEFKKNLLKQRLFYISSSYELVIDTILFTPLSNRLRGKMSAIGLRAGSGGFQTAYNILATGGPNQKIWQDVYKKGDQMGVDLREREYAEGDWSGYDQTLRAQMLAITISLMRCITDDENSTTLSQSTIVELIVFFIKSTVLKTVYVYGTDKHYNVWGTMFSGKKCTSSGDTLYQMVACVVYTEVLRRARQEEPVVQLIIEGGLLEFFFYGDDQIAGYPVEINKYLLYPEAKGLLEDFILWSEEHLGLRHKKESFKVFSNLYGARIFITLDDSTIIEVGRRDSLSFLKTKVVDVWLDGIYQGRFPYRETADLLAKMAITTSATKEAKLTACAYSSLARLCSGNLEMYSMLKEMYKVLIVSTGVPTTQDYERFYKTVQSRSLADIVAEEGWPDDFPDLLMMQLKQTAGFQSGVGFPARDLKGLEVPLRTVYNAERYLSGFDPETELSYDGSSEDSSSFDEVFDYS